MGCPACHLFWPLGIIFFSFSSNPWESVLLLTTLGLQGFAQEALSAGSTPPTHSLGSFLLIFSNPSQEPAFSESLSCSQVWSKFFPLCSVVLAQPPLYTVTYLQLSLPPDCKLQTRLYFCIQVESKQPWPGSLRSGNVELGQGAGLG